jgi:RNA polymerase sigma-70 factor (ECF subfamily)
MFIEPERSRFLIELLNGNESEKKVALKLLHEETYISLYRKLISMYGCDVETAEDVLQETFIKVYTTSNYPENPKTLYAWLTMISRNVLIDSWRKNKKLKIKDTLKNEVESSDDDNRALLHQGDDENETYGDVSLIVEDEFSDDLILKLEKAELTDCVQNAIQKLRDKSTDKAMVLEWSLEGLSSKDISELIRRTDDATRQLLSEARKALRKFAQPCYEMSR